MRVRLEDLSPEKRAAVQDFKTDITSVFNDLYEDKWDQERWERAVGKRLFVPAPSWFPTVLPCRCANALIRTLCRPIYEDTRHEPPHESYQQPRKMSRRVLEEPEG